MSRKRVSLSVVQDCPPVRSSCTRAGCRWYLASELSEAGSFTIGNVGAGRGVTIPERITRRGQTYNRLVEWAARMVAANARRRRPACLWTVVAAHPDGLDLDSIGEAIGVSGEAVRLIEQRALRKLGVSVVSMLATREREAA